MLFGGCHGNFKNRGHTVDLPKFTRKMKEHLLKVSVSSRTFPFHNFQKKKKKTLEEVE